MCDALGDAKTLVRGSGALLGSRDDLRKAPEVSGRSRGGEGAFFPALRESGRWASGSLRSAARNLGRGKVLLAHAWRCFVLGAA